MAKNINTFKANFKGGARPTLYECRVNFPGDVASGPDISEKTAFLVKAASMPSSVLSAIEVPYRGRKLKVAGDRTFEPWTLTVINDVDFEVRNAFERWMELINANIGNISFYSERGGQGPPLGYYTDMEIYQLDRDGEEGNYIKAYQLIGCFPTNLSAIEVGYENVDAIEEYTIEIQYQYWISDTTTPARQRGN